MVYGAYAAVAIVVVAVAAACTIAVTRPARLSRLGAAFDEAGQRGTGQGAALNQLGLRESGH